jgi:hypothetical protein
VTASPAAAACPQPAGGGARGGGLEALAAAAHAQLLPGAAGQACGRLRAYQPDATARMHFADARLYAFGFGECVSLPEDAFAADGAPTFCTEAPR